MSVDPARIPRPTLLDQVELPGAQRYPRVFKLANPIAGADIAIPVAPGTVWKIVSIQAQLVTSAVVGNRVVGMAVTDGTLTFRKIGGIVTQAASQTIQYTWLKDLGFVSTANGGWGDMNVAPPGPLLGGWSIITNTLLIDVADQWSNIIVDVVELRPPAGGSVIDVTGT